VPLLNYTTTIDVSKTVAEIQKMLVRAGAQSILSNYDDGYIVSLSWQMPVKGQTLGFRLPTNWQPVFDLLSRQKTRQNRVQVTQDQAMRTAWRITKDWIEAQLAIIETRMVEPEQVFLPYMMNRDGRTIYESFKESGFKQLSGGA